MGVPAGGCDAKERVVRLERIRRESLVDEVAERIRHVVTESHLQSGDRLPTEMELVSQLGISRNVLREAVGRLESLGLVTVRRGLGMFVADRSDLSSCAKLLGNALMISPKELRLFAELRRAIECHAVRSAAERATSEDLAELEALCMRMEATADDVGALDADVEFHRRLIDMTGNRLIQHVMEVVHEFMAASIVRAAQGVFDRSPVSSIHAPMLEAIRNHDPDAAEQAMRVHMDISDRRIDQVEEAVGDERSSSV